MNLLKRRNTILKKLKLKNHDESFNLGDYNDELEIKSSTNYKTFLRT